MELVPFLDKWAGSETKLDLKAIYRRPDKGITLTGPLPVRRHADWAGKGFSWVSLATMADLGLVAGELRAMGYDPHAMRSGFDRQGNFDVPQYLRAAQQQSDAFRTEVQAKVAKFGLDAVTELMRMSDPTFEMPEGIVGDRAEDVVLGGGLKPDAARGAKK